MTQREYYTYKRDAEDARRIMEQHTSLPHELHKGKQGWYVTVSGDYSYKTADGYTIQVGDTVYDRYNNSYEVDGINIGETEYNLSLIPLETEEFDKDKDVREGIVWLVDRLPAEIAQYHQGTSSTAYYRTINFVEPLINDADGRNTIADGDYIFSTRLNKMWSVTKTGMDLVVRECNNTLEVLNKRLQCVYVHNNKALPVKNVGIYTNKYMTGINQFYYNKRSDKAVKWSIIGRRWLETISSDIGCIVIGICHLCISAVLSALVLQRDEKAPVLLVAVIIASAWLGFVWLYSPTFRRRK